MAAFEVLTYKVDIHPHPNADALEIARIGDYEAIVKKGEFASGDTIAYIPEGSVVPENLLDEMGLRGRLAGKQGNRVKAIRLRGVLSQGLVYAMPRRSEGEDVTEDLGVTKWVPPVPVHLDGEAKPTDGWRLNYDIENIKKYPDVLQDGEPVVITEKLHGTWCCLARWNGDRIAASKGLASQGISFKLDADANRHNLYVNKCKELESVLDELEKEHGSFSLIGEIFGRKVQDLDYGLTGTEFRAFDFRTDGGRYLSWSEFENLLAGRVETVPLLWKGEFSREVVDEFTDGRSVIGGGIREGVVVRAEPNRHDEKLGRVQLKSVSSKYLLRRGKTTEFE